MFKKSILAIALTLTLASATNVFAAPKQTSADNYGTTLSHQADEMLFDRAKGVID